MEPKEFFERLAKIVESYQGIQQDEYSVGFCIGELEELIDEMEEG